MNQKVAKYLPMTTQSMLHQEEDKTFNISKQELDLEKISNLCLKSLLKMTTKILALIT